MFSLQQLQNSLLGNNSTHNKYRLWSLPDLQANANKAINSGSAVDWIKIEKALKQIGVIDKSRVLQGKLREHSDIVIKIGDGLVQHELDIGKVIGKQRGYIRFLGHFHCNDDYLEHNGKKMTPLCKSKGNTMKVIIMPHYPLGSVGDYPWTHDTLPALRSLLKQAILFYMAAYEATGFIHKDLHDKNILISDTALHRVRKTFKDGTTIVVPTHGKTAVLMDFEISRFSQSRPMDTYDFYHDIQRMLTLLPDHITWLSKASIQLLTNFVGKNSIEMKPISSLYPLFDMIDTIQ